MKVANEATEVRVLAGGDGFVAVRFGFTLDDPGLQLLHELVIGPNGGDRRESHGALAELGQADCFTSAGCFVARELVAQVDAEVMHDHRDAGGTGSVRAEDREEGRIAVVGVLGVVEKAGLFPLAAADVGFGGKLADHPSIGRVDGDRFFVDVFALNEGLIATLG